MPLRRFAMVTIGQTPRTDMVPEIVAELASAEVTLVEFGALDGLDEREIAAIAPGPGVPRLVSRLRDGGEVTLAKARVEELLNTLLLRLDTMGLDAIVLLCTGHFGGLRLRTPLIEAQVVVDETTAALARSVDRIGVLVPHQEQISEFHAIAVAGNKVAFSHASPYGDMRFAGAGRELADSDVIVMHCMGYSEAMRLEVAEASGRPVVLARQIVAHAIRDFAGARGDERAGRLTSTQNAVTGRLRT